MKKWIEDLEYILKAQERGIEDQTDKRLKLRELAHFESNNLIKALESADEIITNLKRNIARL